MYTITKLSILIIASVSCQALLQADQFNFHKQLNAVLLKNITIENPSKQEQTLINVAKAFLDFGTPLKVTQPENWHALQSVDFFSILEKHNQTQTAFGCRMLHQQCVNITDDVAILKSRQECIQFLHKNPELIKKISNILNQSIIAEQFFLNLFKEVDQSANDLYFSSKLFSKFNENSTALELSTRCIFTLPICVCIFSFLKFSMIKNYAEDPTNSGCISKLRKATHKSLCNIIEDKKEFIKVIAEGTGSYTAAIALVIANDALAATLACCIAQATKKLLDIVYEKQQDLIVISHLIKALKALKSTFEQNEQFAQVMTTEYAKLTELFDQKNTQTSTDLKKLIKKFLSSSFGGTGSYLFSQQGKILATHHLLVRIKGELIPYLEAFGQIDAYLATVKLYEQFQDHENAQFCFPEYISNDTPIFNAKNFWHPLLDASTVVCNDLDMGNQSSHANLIITGPNAGGKTTALMASIINIIFAQTLGIAPCSSLQITPFAKIHSSLDITTNLKEGLSLFAAEVDRAKKLKNSIMSCTSDQKTFTIIDELFTGTAEPVASEIGFKFATVLGNMKNSMMIITTHIKHLTKLETETNCFMNYKVADANIDATGKITYPFKLVKGISNQNIAEQIMEQENIF